MTPQTSPRLEAATAAETRWERLKDVVADAQELPPAERAAFLDRACDGDALLRSEAASLVEAGTRRAGTCVLHPRADRFLGLSGPDPSAMTGRRVGRYELVRPVGEGAMSAVYLARQDGLDRPVAVKILRSRALAYDAAGRFEREVRALSRLDHPGIARILDAGVEAGVPFIAMEYVPGLPLTRAAREAGLSLRERLRLVADVADAVQAAHGRAVVHRDLKPDNVLVIPADRPGVAGRPKVLDFGIARVLDEVDDARPAVESAAATTHVTMRTTAGVLLGTLGYMAPEQARGEADGADVRLDVYALGAMLHELAVGRLPVDTAGLPLPVALSRLGDPDVSPRSIGTIPGDFTGGDLHAVLSTALASEPARRYASAEALARDLRRMLADEPVSARPPTRTYLARKFARRHRAGVAATAVAALTLTAGTTVATVGLVREAAARRDAESARAQAEQALAVSQRQNQRSFRTRRFIGEILESADLSGDGGAADATLLSAVRGATARLGTRPGDDPLVESELRVTLARALRSLGEIGEADEQFALSFDAAERAYAAGESDVIGVVSVAAERGHGLAIVGRAVEARRVLDQARAALDADGPDNLATDLRRRVEIELLSTEAAVLDAEGRYGEAADLYLEAIGQASAVVGEDLHQISAEEIATMRNNAGSALLSADRVEEGEATLADLLAQREATQGPGHYKTLVARLNHASAVYYLGDLDAAEAELRRTIEAAESLPTTSPLRCNAQEMLMNVLLTRGDAASVGEAVEVGRSVLAWHRERDERDGDGAIGLPGALSSLGVALTSAERPAEAVPLYAEAVDLTRDQLGDSHPSTLTLRANLAQALSQSGDREAALAQMRSVLSAEEAVLGPDHQSSTITRNNVAMLLLELERPEESRPMLARCVAAAEAAGWPTIEPILRRNLGRAELACGDVAAAEATLLKAHADAAPLGEHHQQRTAGFVAEVYDAKGDAAEAARWRGLAGQEFDESE